MRVASVNWIATVFVPLLKEEFEEFHDCLIDENFNYIVLANKFDFRVGDFIL